MHPYSFRSLLPLAGLLLTHHALAQDCDRAVYGSGGEAYDRAGSALHLTGDLMLVGAHESGDATLGRESGAVFVEARVPLTGEWITAPTLRPQSLSAYDHFGAAIDAEGAFVVIGAPNESSGLATSAGRAFVYQHVGVAGTFQLLAILTPSDGAVGDQFGASVAISGDRILVGAPGHDLGGNDSGAVYVFERSGSTWSQLEKLLQPQTLSGRRFGDALALDGPHAVVGGDQLSGAQTGTGAVAAYEENAAGFYDLLHVVDPGGLQVADFYGADIALEGGLLVVGASHDDLGATRGGAVYAFRYDAATSQFALEQKLVPFSIAYQDLFGVSVDTDGQTIVGGATGRAGGGAAWAYRHDGTTWAEHRYLQPAAAYASGDLGVDVAVKGDLVVIGDDDDDTQGFAAGAAHVVDLRLLDLDVDGVSDACEGWAATYCGPAAVNSSGQSARIAAAGSPFVSENHLLVSTRQLPIGVFGFYLTSETQGHVVKPGGSAGDLCLGGTIGRFLGQLQNSGAEGVVTQSFDLTAMPATVGGSVAAGETWNFQLWYRDADPLPTSNFSDAIAVSFQ